MGKDGRLDTSGNTVDANGVEEEAIGDGVVGNGTGYAGDDGTLNENGVDDKNGAGVLDMNGAGELEMNGAGVVDTNGPGVLEINGNGWTAVSWTGKCDPVAL